MDFLKRVVISAGLFIVVVMGLVASGLDVESAKFQVIAALMFWGLVVFYLHEYIPFIALMETLPYRGLESDDTPVSAWKFLAWIMFIIAGFCFLAW